MKHVGVVIAFGVCAGAALGVAMQNLAVGVGIGVAIGSAMGLAFSGNSDTLDRKKAASDKPPRNPLDL